MLREVDLRFLERFWKINKKHRNTSLKDVAQIAIYDNLVSPPRVINLADEGILQLIDNLSAKTYNLAKEKGGAIPFTAIKEVVENLIHAYFKQAVISILDDGNTIRISDQGPGIKNKDSAMRPGFTTATKKMKEHIKGVGSGLPIANEVISFSGGKMTVEDNISGGTVITLSTKINPLKQKNPSPEKTSIKLEKRQVQVLSLVTEVGAIGPSVVSSELKISLSTAHRELSCLEDMGLVESDSQGKRSITTNGINFLNQIIRNQKGARFEH